MDDEQPDDVQVAQPTIDTSDPVAKALIQTEPGQGSPNWTVADAPDPEVAQGRMQDFLRTHAIAHRSYDEVQQNWKSSFGDVKTPDEDAYKSWQDRADREGLLDRTRAQAAKEPVRDGAFDLQNSRLNQVGLGFGFVQKQMYDAAKERFDAGEPTGQDYGVIANYEKTQSLLQQDQQGFAGKARAAALAGPSIIGQMHMAAPAIGVLANAAMPAALAEAGGIGAGAARLGIRAAAMNTVVPGMGPEASIAGYQEGGAAGAAKGFAQSYGRAVVMEAMFGASGALTGKLGGAGGALAAGAGMTAAQPAIDAVNYAARLSPRYGAVQDIVEGRKGEAAAEAMMGFLTNVAMMGSHSPEVAKVQADTFKQAVDSNYSKGFSAGKAILDAAEKAQAVVPKEPPTAQNAPGTPQAPGGPKPAETPEVAPAGQPGGPTPENAPQPAPEAPQAAPEAWDAAKTELMRSALKSVTLKDTAKWSPEKVRSEAEKLGLDKFAERPVGAQAINESVKTTPEPPDRRGSGLYLSDGQEVGQDSAGRTLVRHGVTGPDGTEVGGVTVAKDGSTLHVKAAAGDVGAGVWRGLLRDLADKYPDATEAQFIRTTGPNAGKSQTIPLGKRARGAMTGKEKSTDDVFDSLLAHSDALKEITRSAPAAVEAEKVDSHTKPNQEQADGAAEVQRIARELGLDDAAVSRSIGSALRGEHPADRGSAEGQAAIPITAATRTGILDRIDAGEGGLTDRQKAILGERLIHATGFREIGEEHGISQTEAANEEAAALKSLGYTGTVDQLHLANRGALQETGKREHVGADGRPVDARAAANLRRIRDDLPGANKTIEQIAKLHQEWDSLDNADKQDRVRGKLTPERKEKRDARRRELRGLLSELQDQAGPNASSGPGGGQAAERPAGEQASVRRAGPEPVPGAAEPVAPPLEGAGPLAAAHAGGEAADAGRGEAAVNKLSPFHREWEAKAAAGGRPKGPLTVYRGNQLSTDPTKPNLTRQLDIADVIAGRGPQIPGERAPFNYFTESKDAAQEYANSDQNYIAGTMRSHGWSRQRAEESFRVLHGRDPVTLGTVTEHQIAPKKVLDLSDLGEAPNVREILGSLVRAEGIDEKPKWKGSPEGAVPDNEAARRQDALERDFIQHQPVNDDDRLPPWALMRNSPDRPQAVGEFVDWMKKNGYDAVRYAENRTRHYALLDDAGQSQAAGNKLSPFHRSWEAKAAEAGVEPADLHATAKGFVDHNKAQNEGEGSRNQLIDHAYSALKEFGINHASIRAMERKGQDAAKVKGFDEVAGDLADNFPSFFKGSEHPIDTLLDILKEGKSAPLKPADAYQHALDHLINEKEAARAKQEAQRGGWSEGAAAKALRLGQEDGEAERRGEIGDAAEPGPDDLEHGHGTDFDFGANARSPALTDAERRTGVIGGGQPNAVGAERPGRLTALAHEAVDADRAKEGLPPLMKMASRKYAAVWDQALAKMDADPQLAERLVDQINTGKKKSTSTEENAILAAEMVSAKNANDRAQRAYIEASKPQNKGNYSGLDFADMEAAQARAEKRYDAVTKASDMTGSEAGSAFNFRKQLIAEDYSLSGMLQKAAAAKGEPLTEDEKSQINDLQAKITDLQTKLDAAEKEYKESGAKPGTIKFDDMQRARSQVGRAQGEFKDQIGDFRSTNRPISQKIGDALLAWQRFSILSGVKTLGKIGTASAQTFAVNPAKELAGAAWGWVPGISKIAAKANFEGQSSAAGERSSFMSIVRGIKDGVQKATTGRTDLDAIYSKEERSRSWLDWPQAIHAAIKAPALRAAYERLFTNGLAAEEAAGRDASSPAAILRVGAEAYREAHRAIFMEDNKVVDAVNRAIDSMRNPQNSFATQAIGTAAKTLLPIVKVPTNVVAQSFEAAFGLIPGLTRAASIPFRGGIDNLSNDQANLILRQLKSGTVGGAMFLLGAFAPNHFGGFYTNPADEKKRGSTGDLPPGAVRVGGVTLPAWTQHNPVLLAGQMGAAFRRTLDKTYRGQDQSFADAFIASAGGMLLEAPIINEPGRLAEAFKGPGGWGRMIGQYVSTFAVPRAVQDVAEATDSAKSRKATGTWQTIEKGVPGLRQRVPVGQ